MNCLNGRCASGNRHCAAAVCHVYIIAQWGEKKSEGAFEFVFSGQSTVIWIIE